MKTQCNFGVGCDEYGVCYAAAHGQPERCGKPNPMDVIVENAQITTFHDVSWDAFTRLAKEFHKALPAAKTSEEVEAGFKCIGLAYLGLTTKPKNEIERISILVQAPILLRMLAKDKLNRELELIC